ncbi:MAG: hypothetical protein LC112_11045 [Flavobacteriales bacterium]|nr:hypothetical protein [Flavobacteriales bacterium]
MKNPQNAQYYGDHTPYPLELGDYHRYLIPNDQNAVENDLLSVYCVNESGSYILSAVCKVVDGFLKYVTFKSDKAISGRLQIRNNVGDILYYSNCIEFIDSTDENGRKFIRIATKHTYNRNLFDFQGEYNWIITSLPAYCLGLNSVEAEINNARTGGISTLKTRETYIDEITDYEFVSRGDSNVLNFVQVHVTNNQFFVDGTKRTSIDKIDRDEFSISGKVKLTNVKDKLGYNIFIDETELFVDIYDSIYADPINYNFAYSHTPEDTPNEGNWFLTNLLYNNYHNPFGIIYDCALQFKITSVPVKGFLANNTTFQIYSVDDIISYCDKDELVYYPNGFNNDLGVSGNYVETFSYKIVDQGGRIGRLITHTINMTDIAAPSIDISASISWIDDSSAPKSGNSGNEIVKLVSLVSDPLDPIITQEWQTFDGTNWNFYKTKTTDNETFELTLIENKIRLKVISQFGEVTYSNNLIYTKQSISKIYVTDAISINGNTSYKLHVENSAFVGYANTTGSKINATNANVYADYGDAVYIPNSLEGERVFSSSAVNIPIGVYDLNISANGMRKISNMQAVVNGEVSFGYSTDFYAPASPSAVAYVELVIEAD